MPKTTIPSASISTLDRGNWTIICDFDGTITPFDVTDAILSQFAPPEWETLERDWLAGAITAKECMEKQVRLISAPRDELDAFLDSVPVTDGFGECVSFCLSRNMPMVVLSDGMDYAIKRILARNGLGFVPVIANRLRFRGRYGHGLEFPYGVAGCGSGVCKCEVARALGGETLLVGDGRSDCCLAGKASFVMAREGKELQTRCRAEGYPHVAWRDFFDVRAFLETMPGMPRADVIPQTVMAV